MSVHAKYNVEVDFGDLHGSAGNAFAVMGTAANALRQLGADKAEVDEYMDAATSGDYNDLLRTTLEWVNSEGIEYFLDDLDEEY